MTHLDAGPDLSANRNAFTAPSKPPHSKTEREACRDKTAYFGIPSHREAATAFSVCDSELQAILRWPHRSIMEALLVTQQDIALYRRANAALLSELRALYARSIVETDRIAARALADSDRKGFPRGQPSADAMSLAESVIRSLGNAMIEAQVRALHALDCQDRNADEDAIRP